jgi:hypothetical protein
MITSTGSFGLQHRGVCLLEYCQDHLIIRPIRKLGDFSRLPDQVVENNLFTQREAKCRTAKIYLNCSKERCFLIES